MIWEFLINIILSLQEGGSKFRYYAMLGLMTDKGFVANANMNDGYSTQDKYSSANLRTNLDIDLTSTTKLKLNLLGSLSESSRPGTSSTDLWDMVYSIPSAAFPILSDDGSWGGSSTWSGTMNPVAQSQGAAYSKGHTRSLLADLTLSQDLSGLVKGLGVSFRLAYDNYSSIWEVIARRMLIGDIHLAGRIQAPVVRCTQLLQVENPVRWQPVPIQTIGHVSSISPEVLIIVVRSANMMFIRS